MLDDADRRATAVMAEQDAYSAEHRSGMPITMARRLALHKYIADEFREADLYTRRTAPGTGSVPRGQDLSAHPRQRTCPSALALRWRSSSFRRSCRSLRSAFGGIAVASRPSQKVGCAFNNDEVALVDCVGRLGAACAPRMQQAGRCGREQRESAGRACQPRSASSRRGAGRAARPVRCRAVLTLAGRAPLCTDRTAAGTKSRLARRGLTLDPGSK